MQTDMAQDPDELFDVVTADGQPTGIRKRRADVHRDGDWHRALHVWVYGVDDGTPFLLLNERGKHKDTQPGKLDATVGGHFGAGETVEDTFREIEEEIGIAVDPATLRHIGTRPAAAEYITPGVIDRELQEVYLCRDDRPLADYRPNPAELDGLVRVALADALGLFVGEGASASGLRLDAHDGAVAAVTIATDHLARIGVDRYFLRVAIAIDRLLRGERYIVV